MDYVEKIFSTVNNTIKLDSEDSEVIFQNACQRARVTNQALLEANRCRDIELADDYFSSIEKFIKLVQYDEMGKAKKSFDKMDTCCQDLIHPDILVHFNRGW